MKLIRIFAIIFLSSVICHLTSTAVHAIASATPTFHSVGLAWQPNDPVDCAVFYRPLGSNTWLTGYPLWYDSRNLECRGSLVHLTPNTTYEIRLTTLTDSTVLTATTWNENLPVDPAKIHYLSADSFTTLTISDSGSASGYALYAPEPGKSITIDVQNNHNTVIQVNASYVIIRGLNLTGGINSIINLNANVHDVVIETNQLSNWGTGANFQGAIIGGGNYSQTNPNLQRLIIQRNKIYNPRFGSNDWSTGHPSGPQGIVLFNSGGHHVFRYNEIFSTNGNYFNDILGAGANFQTECGNVELCTGFPGPDSDIYGNFLSNAWDDAVEADGQGRNVRIWGNYIDSTLVKFSTAGIFKGPIYIFRNVSGIGDAGTTEGGETFIKAGIGNGRIFAFHNTLLNPDGQGCRGGITDAGDSLDNLVSRNNILQTRSVNQYAVRDYGSGHYFDVDYDFYNGKFLLNNTSYTPSHGIPFTNPNFGATKFNQATGLGEFYLTEASGGYHSAIYLPNFNDQSSHPDMGAHQSGTSPMEFGIKAYLTPAPPPTTPSPTPNQADLNSDGLVDYRDFLYLIFRFNQPYSIFDMNRLVGAL